MRSIVVDVPWLSHVDQIREQNRGSRCCGHEMASDIEASADVLKYVGFPLRVEIELVAAQRPGEFPKDPWECSIRERLEEAALLKEKGNAHYKGGDIRRAVAKYERALLFLESLLTARYTDAWETAGVDEAECIALRNVCKLNYAATKLKLGDYSVVVRECTDVLNDDPNNVKARYRRAQALLRRGRDADKALAEFRRTIHVHRPYAVLLTLITVRQCSRATQRSTRLSSRVKFAPRSTSSKQRERTRSERISASFIDSWAI